MLSLGVDYLFMVSYAGMLWAGLTWISEDLGSRAKYFVRAVAAGALLAGLTDAVENYLLIHVIRGGDVSALGLLASICATIKFALVAVSLLVFALLGIRRAAIKR